MGLASCLLLISSMKYDRGEKCWAAELAEQRHSLATKE